MRKLRESGWESFVVWECETSDSQKLKEKLTRMFSIVKSVR